MNAPLLLVSTSSNSRFLLQFSFFLFASVAPLTRSSYSRACEPPYETGVFFVVLAISLLGPWAPADALGSFGILKILSLARH